MTTVEFRESLKAARRVSTPLVCIRSADPASAIAHIRETMAKEPDTKDRSAKPPAPLLSYNFITSVTGINTTGTAALSKVSFVQQAGDPAGQTAAALSLAPELPEDSILIIHNAHKVWESPEVIQAAWNLRDPFKETGKMLVLLTSAGAILPSELASDVM